MTAITPIKAGAGPKAYDCGLGLAEAIVGQSAHRDRSVRIAVVEDAPHESDFLVLGLLLGPCPAGRVGSNGRLSPSSGIVAQAGTAIAERMARMSRVFSIGRGYPVRRSAATDGFLTTAGPP